MPSPILTQTARAKINLTLHVGAARADGYHPLDSLVIFAQLGDVVTAQKSDQMALEIEGPFSKGLSTGPDNLILKAARATGLPPAKFTLTKNLPIASGIGGGSADAAATLRLMQALYHPIDNADAIALSIGADVPVCLTSKTCVMRGIGEAIVPIEGDTQLPAVLVNPGAAVSTGAIFKAFDATGEAPTTPKPQADLSDLLSCAKAGQNDLEGIACRIESSISDVLSALKTQTGAQLARMSGSGATCFAIFETQDQARHAAGIIQSVHPNWWCEATVLGGRL